VSRCDATVPTVGHSGTRLHADMARNPLQTGGRRFDCGPHFGPYVCQERSGPYWTSPNRSGPLTSVMQSVMGMGGVSLGELRSHVRAPSRVPFGLH
jgi:hypothetical protein